MKILVQTWVAILAPLLILAYWMGSRKQLDLMGKEMIPAYWLE